MLRSALAACVALSLLLIATPAPAAPPTDTPVEYAEIGRSTIGYRDLNPGAEGPPLVLINGFGLTMTEWHPDFVAELASKRRVVTFDNRAIGYSTGPVGRLTVRKMAKDTIRLIGALGIRRADVAGLSMGGYIAQRVAIQAPRRVRRLLLISTDPGSPAAVQAAPWVVKRLNAFASPQSLLPILFPKDEQAAGNAWLTAIAQQPNLTAEDFRTPDRTVRKQAQATARAWYGRGKGVYHALPKIKAKTLVAFGSKDVVVPPANGPLIAERIKRSSTLRFPGGGHLFAFQAPKAKAKRLAAFLDRR